MFTKKKKKNKGIKRITLKKQIPDKGWKNVFVQGMRI